MTSPPVSAIIPPAQEEGKRAMTELLELLDGKRRIQRLCLRIL